MRPKTIDDETLAKIADDIRAGVLDTRGAAERYGVPYSTLCRRLGQLSGNLKAERRANVISEIRDYCAKNGINIHLLRTTHQKLLAMDMVTDRFDAADLCAAFEVSMDSYTKHRKIVAKGPNSYQQRETEIEGILRSVFQVTQSMMPNLQSAIARHSSAFSFRRTESRPAPSLLAEFSQKSRNSALSPDLFTIQMRISTEILIFGV